METITLRREKNISELIEKIYGQVNDENARKRLEDALLRENPQLSAIENLPEGSLIKLPAIEEITAAKAEDQQTGDPRGWMGTQARIDLNSYRKQLTEAIEQEKNNIERQLEAIESVANQIRDIEPDGIDSLINHFKQRYDDLTLRREALEDS